jgi:hypothetical protein
VEKDGKVFETGDDREIVGSRAALLGGTAFLYYLRIVYFPGTSG